MRGSGKAIVVLGAAGAVALAGAGVANAATGTTITVKAIQTSSHVIKDTPPTGQPNPGDKYAFTEKLLQNNKKVGTDKVVVTLQNGGKALADGVFTFKTGTLHAHGTLAFANNKPIVLPVVGGTGAYAGKKGTLTVTSHGKYATEVFNLK